MQNLETIISILNLKGVLNTRRYHISVENTGRSESACPAEDIFKNGFAC